MAGIARRLQLPLEKYGIPVQVGVRKKPTGAGIVTACPCTTENNPWRSYNQAWHHQHPEAPNCKGTGKLVDFAEGVRGGPITELRTIQAVVLPNYGATGQEMNSLPPGMAHQWNWLAITQDTSVFTELQFRDNAGTLYRFVVENRMPYYVENVLEAPAALIYSLLPVETAIPMEDELEMDEGA